VATSLPQLEAQRQAAIVAGDGEIGFER